ncbi:NPC intracellular cholesterol transporter 1-like [Haliotis rubra]|uniref:NPC intracellular cholesterol transporter 1-like n=1 Tax=Haliotis rubra TaxID=36100 RepID=UPI001EE56662|nr:NPC intracellular cholesterol transporter 1-like [Haliotis rubra]
MAKVVASSAGRALGLPISKFKSMGGMHYTTYRKLFDAMVGAAIWATSNSTYATTIQNRAMKFYMEVRKSTPNAAVTGDMGWTPTPATPAGHGQCVMYGMCGVNPNTGKPVPCAYTGPPKPLTDPTARRVLEERCPDFSHDTSTCCDAHQLSWLQSMLTVPDQILGNCPACNYNFRNVFCNMVCSPKQSDFVTVTSTSSQSVTAIKYDVTTTFADGMYKSCKDVTMPSPGGNALGFSCGWPADECSPKRLLYYLGNVRNGQSAFSIKFDVTESPDALPSGVTLYPMNATTIPCSSPVGKRSRCSCRDCGAVPSPTTTVAPNPCTKSQKGGIQKAPGYASLHLLIQRLGNHSRIQDFYPPPSLQSIMFQAVFEKASLHQVSWILLISFVGPNV